MPRLEKFEIRIFPILFLLFPLSALRAGVTYQEVIHPLFQDSCLNCHNPDKHKAGLDLSTYDSTMDGSDNGKVIEIGRAEKSVLYKVLTHVEEPYMPKNADKLPESQLETIRQWIEANAPEKAGEMASKKDAGPTIGVVTIEEKPQGPPPIPHNGLLEPVIHTARPGSVPSVAGSPWAPLVALAAQKQVLLYNTDSLELVGVLPFPEGFPAIVRFSRNGSLLIAGGGIGAKMGHVVIWDVVTGRRVTQVGDEFDTVLAADISPDQSLVALGGPSRLVKIFSAVDGRMVCKMKKHTDWVTALCFTPDGKQLISGDRAGGLSMWDCEGHEIQSVSAHAAAVTGIACRGKLIATTSEDGTVKFWDIEEEKEIKSWHAHNGGVRSIAFTPDGRVVTSGRDRLVRLWDVNGQLIKQFGPLSDVAMQAAFVGGKIVAADWAGMVREWTNDGKRAGDLDSNPPTIAQRIDALNRRLAELLPLQARAGDACKHAADALSAARKRIADGAAALDAKKAALAAAQDRDTLFEKQSTTAAAAVQRGQDETTRLHTVAEEIACASAANPLLQPAFFSTLTSRAVIAQSLGAQEAEFEQTRRIINSVREQSAALAHEIEAQARTNTIAAAGVKSAEAALAAAQSFEGKTAGEIKAENLELLKWRAAARLAGDPQFASWKADPK